MPNFTELTIAPRDLLAAARSRSELTQACPSTGSWQSESGARVSGDRRSERAGAGAAADDATNDQRQRPPACWEYRLASKM
jgi:hypothetical protein